MKTLPPLRAIQFWLLIAAGVVSALIPVLWLTWPGVQALWALILFNFLSYLWAAFKIVAGLFLGEVLLSGFLAAAIEFERTH